MQQTIQKRRPELAEMELFVMSQGKRAGGRGLVRVVREHKARLRIICRCVALLVCHRD